MYTTTRNKEWKVMDIEENNTVQDMTKDIEEWGKEQHARVRIREEQSRISPVVDTYLASNSRAGWVQMQYLIFQNSSQGKKALIFDARSIAEFYDATSEGKVPKRT
ncbi:hypothetical protein N7539_001418 [Penicillium diatomitis]|uniref:Rhodanese domain-containing protein n=1 Tax=Penicillium diatomitis TaxID=2819901 RepID=A0A9W9XGN1_9EURO|nr:uncharacterized protein N7539_001418 [Penicillium diatomitis]KAJ5492672.1 hypothetical protein N7539_001418 [Penicillium diatomitis]